MNELLNKLYYDPKTGFIGAQALYHKAKRLEPKITFKVVMDWYSIQTDIQQYQEQRKRFNGCKIASYNPNSWQMDLAFWEKQPILTAININSRLGFAKVLSNKTATTVLAALKAFVRHHKVDIITSDNGSEFMSSQAQEFFQAQKIEHYNNEPGDHGTMGKSERFNRTLRQRITKMSPKRITQRLITDVIENYNSTFQRSIKTTPNEAKGKVMDADLSHNQAEPIELRRSLRSEQMCCIDLRSRHLIKKLLDGAKPSIQSLELINTESKSVRIMVIPSTRHQTI
ncbi:unnamed protein product [Phytophthora lilii]|uniref:Unnamed protein product n=1 Tax=Phytophthora lilii TaxID=2077276 RepID=A0A9W6WSB5_9STRA|nr:unnamed protein product [Phytophthora lilii]